MNRSTIFLLLFFIYAIARADEFGRLFFTPEQRKQLDAGLELKGIVQPQAAATQILNGVVQRPDGTRTIWINGMAQIKDGNGQAADMQMLVPPGKSRPVPIRVGQRLVPEQPAGQ